MPSTTQTDRLQPQVLADVLAAVSVTELPDFIWLTGDDKCDCTYQRIGFWTNPYLAVTLETRLCCLFAELAKVYPQFFRVTEAAWDSNEAKWVKEPAPWDSEDVPMPVAIWYRQIARRTGKTLAEVREEYRGRENERPKAVSARRRRYLRKDPSLEARTRARTETLKHSGWVVGNEIVPARLGEVA